MNRIRARRGRLLTAALTIGLLGSFCLPGQALSNQAQSLRSGASRARSAANSYVKIEEERIPLADSVVRTPSTGDVTYSGGGATIDASNTAEGYVLCKYEGDSAKIKVQITRSGSSTYTYTLNSDGYYEVFPLTSGDGNYTINIFKNVYGNQYSQLMGQTVSVKLSNPNIPFLYPNQYVNYDAGSATVAAGATLSQGASSELEVVAKVYDYVVNNITYDTAKANQIVAGGLSGYLPSVDTILASGKGICFDYAALMATMLRTQNIPTRMEVGYVSGGAYHAWLGVYVQDVGWIDEVIYFDGQNWKLMDPTFASSGGQTSATMQYIGNGSNYSTYYLY